MIAYVLSRARLRIRLTGRAIALLVLVGALLIASIYPLRTYLHQRSEIGSLQQRVGELQRGSAALDHRIARLHDPRYLEVLARECLGMVKKGEITFVIVPKQNVPLPRDC
jgi:cell division protein FtsB